MRQIQQPPRPFPVMYRLRRISWPLVGRAVCWIVAGYALLILVTHIAPQVLGMGQGWR